jgi:hypothetical protein
MKLIQSTCVALASACGLVLAAAPASAAIINIQMTGYVVAGVNDDIDSYGFFGAPGANLAGLPFSETVTMDDSSPYSASYSWGLHYIRGSRLFATFPQGAEPIDETLSIDGTTFDLVGQAQISLFGYGYLFRGKANLNIGGGLIGTIDGLQGQYLLDTIYGFPTYSWIGNDYHNPISDTNPAYFIGTAFDFMPNNVAMPQEQLVLQVQTLQLASSGTPAPFIHLVDFVPEPSGWMSLLAGMGSIGALTRARRGGKLAPQGYRTGC